MIGQNNHLNLYLTPAKHLSMSAGHSGMQNIYHTAFSLADSKVVTVGGDENSCRVWDATTGYLLNVFQIEEEQLFSAAFSPNGKYLAVTGGKACYLWDIETSRLLYTLEGYRFSDHEYPFSPDSKRILWKADNRLGILEIETGEKDYIPIRIGYRLENKDKAVFSRHGQEIIILAGLKIQIWDWHKEEKLFQFEIPEAHLVNAAFSYGGNFMAGLFGYLPTYDFDSYPDTLDLMVWEVHSGKKIVRYSVDSREGGARISPDGTYVGVGSNWHEISNDRKIALDRNLTIDAISQDNLIGLNTESWNNVYLIDLSNGKIIRRLEGHIGDFSRLSFSLDGKYAISSSSDFGQFPIHVWDLRIGHAQRVLVDPMIGWPYGCVDWDLVLISPNNQYIVARQNESKLFTIWDINTGQLLHQLEFHEDDIEISKDGNSLLSLEQKWDLKSGNVVETYEKRDGWTNLSLSADGNQAIARCGSIIFLLETHSMNIIGSFDTQIDHITRIIYGQNSKYILLVEDGVEGKDYLSKLLIWDIENNTTMDGFIKSKIRLLAVSPNHEFIIFEDEEAELYEFWDLNIVKKVGILPYESANFYPKALSSDMRFLLAGGDFDVPITYWELYKSGEISFLDQT